MRQLTCKICGSTDLVRQDDFFTCQTCGAKYSVEEATRMMLEDEPNASEPNESEPATDSKEAFSKAEELPKEEKPVFTKKHSIIGLIFGASAIESALFALIFLLTKEASLISSSYFLFFMASIMSVVGFLQSMKGKNIAQKAGGSAGIVTAGNAFATIGSIVTILGLLIAILVTLG